MRCPPGRRYWAVGTSPSGKLCSNMWSRCTFSTCRWLSWPILHSLAIWGTGSPLCGQRLTTSESPTWWPIAFLHWTFFSSSVPVEPGGPWWGGGTGNLGWCQACLRQSMRRHPSVVLSPQQSGPAPPSLGTCPAWISFPNLFFQHFLCWFESIFSGDLYSGNPFSP